MRTPNGLRYRLVGGLRKRHFDGANSKPRKLLENAQTPTSRVHAVLGGFLVVQDSLLEESQHYQPDKILQTTVPSISYKPSNKCDMQRDLDNIDGSHYS